MANFNEEQIKQIIGRSQSFINYRLAAARKEDSEAITDWIEDILDASQGHRKAHAWTRGTSKAPPLPTHMWKKGEYVSHPHEMGKHLLADWSKVWTQENKQGMPINLWGQLKTLIKNHNQQSGRDKISQEDVKRCIKVLKSATAVGIDQWSPAQWKALSPEAIDGITYLFQYIEEYGVWPGHIFYNIVVLMGKPTGGSRPIALMPMLYRLYTKIRRPQILQWELAHQGPWDAAVKGSSALRAGLLSMLRDEMAVRLGLDTLVTLCDMEKFYDNIDISYLIQEAITLDYDITLLNLGLQIHMAPRGLRCYGFCPGQVAASNGIIAGCTQSTTFTKIYLFAVLQGFWDRYQTRILLGQPSTAAPNDPLPEVDADMRSFIDDMSMATYGKAPLLYEVHAHMGQYLANHLKNRKGKISKKTTIVGTKFSHKLVLQAKYRSFGVSAKIGIAAKDLGIGRAGG